MSTSICAGALIVKDDEVLLGKRTPERERWPSVWDLIGGHCEEYESPEDTLVRELSEEIDITPINFTPFAAIKDSVLGYTFLVYLVTEWAANRPLKKVLNILEKKR